MGVEVPLPVPKFFDNFTEGTAKWLAIRFEPGGLVMSQWRSIRLPSANLSRVRQMVSQDTANVPRVARLQSVRFRYSRPWIAGRYGFAAAVCKTVHLRVFRVRITGDPPNSGPYPN